MDSDDWAVFRNRAIAVGMILVFVLCMLASATRSFVSDVRVNEQGQRVVNENKGNFVNAGGIAIAALLGIAVVVGIIKSFGGYSAHRRKNHAYAEIIWDGDCASQIRIVNLDDVDVAELGRNVQWSSLRSRQHVGSGEWIWNFAYMGDRQYNGRTPEEQYAIEMSDGVHRMYMRGALENINMCLEQVINPMKDRA